MKIQNARAYDTAAFKANTVGVFFFLQEKDAGMETKEKKKLVLDSAVDVDGKKKMPCAKAFQINRENGISLMEIGKICNEEKVKIVQCQLGCFK